MPTNDQIATACRVLGTAVQRDIVLSRPRGVIIYGRLLAPSELRWLVEGLETLDVVHLAQAGLQGEDKEIVGYLLGRVLRIQVRQARLAELHDVLRAAATR